jgi:hypothetical protein
MAHWGGPFSRRPFSAFWLGAVSLTNQTAFCRLGGDVLSSVAVADRIGVDALSQGFRNSVLGLDGLLQVSRQSVAAGDVIARQTRVAAAGLDALSGQAAVGKAGADGLAAGIARDAVATENTTGQVAHDTVAADWLVIGTARDNAGMDTVAGLAAQTAFGRAGLEWSSAGRAMTLASLDDLTRGAAVDRVAGTAGLIAQISLGQFALEWKLLGPSFGAPAHSTLRIAAAAPTQRIGSARSTLRIGSIAGADLENPQPVPVDPLRLGDTDTRGIDLTPELGPTNPEPPAPLNDPVASITSVSIARVDGAAIGSQDVSIVSNSSAIDATGYMLTVKLAAPSNGVAGIYHDVTFAFVTAAGRTLSRDIRVLTMPARG